MELVNEFVSDATMQISERLMQMMREGKIRNHKLANTSTIHHGDLEEQELEAYKRFLLTRNFYNTIQLCGKEDYEEY